MTYFLDANKDNNIPIGNGKILVWLNQQLEDSLSQIFYKDYHVSSKTLGDRGAGFLIRDHNEKVWYDPYHLIDESPGQLGEPVSIVHTEFVEGAGIYRVLSRKGNTLAETTTWIPQEKQVVVRRIRVKTVKNNATKVSIYPLVYLQNTYNKRGQAYISRLEAESYLAVTVTDASWADSGKLLKILKGQKAAEEVHSSRETPVIWQVDQKVPTNDWSSPVYMVFAYGNSEQESLEELSTILESQDLGYQETLSEWSNWFSKGYLIEGNSYYEYLWKVSLSLLRMALQHDGKPIMIGFSPYQGNVWVRDGIWMVLTLAKTGHTEEAIQGLRGIVRLLKKRPDGNYYFAYDCKSGYPNEHSYENDTPGLILTGIAEIVRLSKQEGLLREFSSVIEDSYLWIANNIDETGLITPCAGIWETFGEHLDETPEHMVWTSGIASYGLKEMSSLLGDREMSLLAEQLKSVLLKKTIKGDVLVRSLETERLDSSVLNFFFNYPLFDGKILTNTIQVIQERLWDPFLGGVWRHEDLTTEKGDMRPWIGPTIWLAQAYIQEGDWDRGTRTLATALSFASNCGLLPELMYHKGEPRGLGMPSYSQSGILNIMLQISKQDNPLGLRLKEGADDDYLIRRIFN